MDNTHRFDMHIAFRPSVQLTLENFIGENTDSIVKLGVYRPRVGVFVQAPHCAHSNESGECIIPTFTCNFFSNTFTDANILMTKVEDFIKQNRELRDNLLRTRFEYQMPWHDYDVNKKKLISLYELEPYDGAMVVTGESYYDAHIHLHPIDGSKITRNQYYQAAQLAGKFCMPIIVNISKEKPIPFITVRWYNIEYNTMIKSLENIYNCLYEPISKIGLVMNLIPHIEMTFEDPDCQVTDAGWMPTPSNPFDLTDAHCEPPPELFPSDIQKENYLQNVIKSINKYF